MSDTNYIIGDTPEDLNREHKVTLTEGQISTILFVLEGYINPSEILAYDPECREEIDSIFEELEGVVDEWYKIHDPALRLGAGLKELTPFQEELEVKKYVRDNYVSDYSKIPSRY